MEALVGPHDPGEAEPGRVRQPVEHLGDVLERLALDQSGEQQIALLPQGELVVDVAVTLVGQEAASLQFHQGGGDQQELGSDVEVHRLHPLELAQIGVDDPGQVDLVDVHLLAEDQVEEQVERTFEDGGGDVDRHLDVRLPHANHTSVTSWVRSAACARRGSACTAGRRSIALPRRHTVPSGRVQIVDRSVAIFRRHPPSWTR